MRDRLVTAAGALLALFAVFVISVADYEPAPTRPTSPEAGPNGYLALQDWLRDAGVEVISHRDHLDELEAQYGRNNLFISTAPYQAPMGRDEATKLRAWVAAGNTLVLLAALNDTPNWSIGANASRFLDDLEALTDIEFEVVEHDDRSVLESIQLRRTITLSPVAAHPLASGINTLVGETDHSTDVWQVASADSPQRLRIAVTDVTVAGNEGIDAMWHIPHGRGHILLAGLGSLFVNRNLGKGDNAVLFANIVRHHLPGGAAIFDDMHQGLSNLYDPAAFFSDRRLHASVAFVLALWFLYMVGTWNRLAKPRPQPSEPGQEDFVYAVGGFFARKLGAVEAGRQMMRVAFVELAGPGAKFEQPPWTRLQANPTIDRSVLAKIKADHVHLQAGRRVDLPRLRKRLAQLGTSEPAATIKRKMQRGERGKRGR